MAKPPKTTPAVTKSTASAARTASAVAQQAGSNVITADERERMIAETAYYIAEKRGFQGGTPEQDWLEAEAQVDRNLGGAPAH